MPRMLMPRLHFNEEVGRVIKSHRLQRGRTQLDVAKEIGLSTSSYAAIEEGKGCNLHIAAKLAEAFDVTLDDIAPVSAMIVPDLTG